VSAYPLPSRSSILSCDEAAWNLCYLSFDWDTQTYHKDPEFSVNILRTLQFIVASGEIDLARECPQRTVRVFMEGTPHAAVKKITAMERMLELPMVRAYGTGWLTTIAERSALWREPYDDAFDTEVTDFTQALQVLARM